MTYNWPLYCGMRHEHGWWFRVCGYGVGVTNLARRRTPPLFSERYGYGTWKYAVTVGHYKIRPLTRQV